MKSYRTELVVKPSSYYLSHQNNLLNIGSCFSENIGEQLINYKFPILINPYGILFNPKSIAQALEQIIINKQFSESDIFYHNSRWQSFYHHGRFSNSNRSDCLKNINTSITQTHQHIQNLDCLILTFGTANVFHHKKLNHTVANCHKLPNTIFERKRLEVSEIISAFEPIFKKLKLINPQLKIILTVSPIRHIRDGLIENQRSKSTLLLAVDKLVEKYDFVNYFPAYELVVDDLRDYRFYKDDMIHPSKVAIDYVWEHFINTYFSESTNQINQQIQKINQAKNHRPFDKSTLEYQQFLEKQIFKIKNLQKRYDFLKLKEDLNWFEQQLLASGSKFKSY